MSERKTPNPDDMTPISGADTFLRQEAARKKRERFDRDFPADPREAMYRLNAHGQDRIPTRPLRRQRDIIGEFVLPTAVGLLGFGLGGAVVTTAEFLTFGGSLAAAMPGGLVGCCIAAGLPVGAGAFALTRKVFR